MKETRDKAVSFNENDLIILGVPVYAGRVPNVLLNYCVEICPMGSIDRDDPDYLRHQYELEEQFADRKEPELFL